MMTLFKQFNLNIFQFSKKLFYTFIYHYEQGIYLAIDTHYECLWRVKQTTKPILLENTNNYPVI